MSEYNFVDVPPGMTVQQVIDLKLPIRIKDLTLFHPGEGPCIEPEMYELSGEIFSTKEIELDDYGGGNWFFLIDDGWSIDIDWVEIPQIDFDQSAPTLDETVILNGDKVVLP